jgi:hypothetical protein
VLLSIVSLVAPEFPANVYLLKGISVIAMAGVGVACFRDFTQRSLQAPLAAGLAIAVVSTPAFVFLATSTVMSECVFTLSLLVTLLLVERSLRMGTTGSVVLAAVFELRLPAELGELEGARGSLHRILANGATSRVVLRVHRPLSIGPAEAVGHREQIRARLSGTGRQPRVLSTSMGSIRSARRTGTPQAMRPSSTSTHPVAMSSRT